jgi:hypothetical protein
MSEPDGPAAMEPTETVIGTAQTEEKPKTQSVQSLGGKARAAKLTPDERTEIAQIAAETRWENEGVVVTVKASHDGQLTIGDMHLPCAVLEDGTRVITSAGVMRALNRPWKGTYRRDIRPNFLAGPNLERFIDNELRADLAPIDFRTRKGGYARGYHAELLPKICEVYLRARDADALIATQVSTARAAEIVMRALAHVGIIALVDEATGYQEIRDRLALQEVLRKYITGALFEWTKTFPLEFYKEIFRLKGWEWKPDKMMPSVVGRYTNDLVYNRLASGVLDELQRLNPVSEKGYRRHRHHQYLTRDIGHPALSRRLYELIGMARASESWERFYRLVDRTFPKLNATLALPLGD